MKKSLTGLALLMLIVGCWWLTKGRAQKPDGSATAAGKASGQPPIVRPIPVRVVRAEVGTMERTLEVTGTIRVGLSPQVTWLVMLGIVWGVGIAATINHELTLKDALLQSSPLGRERRLCRSLRCATDATPYLLTACLQQSTKGH